MRLKADEADNVWAFLEAREGKVLAEKVEGLDETAMAEVQKLNARWAGYAFRLGDEKLGDLMVAKADLIAKKK